MEEHLGGGGCRESAINILLEYKKGTYVVADAEATSDAKEEASEATDDVALETSLETALDTVERQELSPSATVIYSKHMLETCN